jgi:hypothetical protein
VAARWPGGRSGADVLAAWAEGLGGRRGGTRAAGCLRFAFYGRALTDDWQDPGSSRARQLSQAIILTAGHGTVVAEFFDSGESQGADVVSGTTLTGEIRCGVLRPSWSRHAFCGSWARRP